MSTRSARGDSVTRQAVGRCERRTHVGMEGASERDRLRDRVTLMWKVSGAARQRQRSTSEDASMYVERVLCPADSRPIFHTACVLSLKRSLYYSTLSWLTLFF